MFRVLYHLNHLFTESKTQVRTEMAKERSQARVELERIRGEVRERERELQDLKYVFVFFSRRSHKSTYKPQKQTTQTQTRRNLETYSRRT